MAGGVGVTYELEFVVKDKNAQKSIEKMLKNAEKLVKAFNNIKTGGFAKQLQSQGDMIKNQLKDAKELVKTLGGKTNFNSGMKNIAKEANAAKKVTEQLNKAKEKVGKKIKSPFVEYAEGARKARELTRQLAKSQADIVKGMPTHPLDTKMQNASMSMGGKAWGMVGGALKNIGQGALKDYVQTDYELRGAAAKTGGFEVDLKQYEVMSKKIAAMTKYTELEIAELMNSNATLGVKSEEMEKFTIAAAGYAQAFNLSPAMAGESIKKIMNSQGIGVDQTQKVVDMMSVTAARTAADPEAIGAAMKYAGAAAKGFNIPLERTLSLVGMLNNIGLDKSTAGTGINQIFTALKKGKKVGLLEELTGKKITDANGNLRDFSEILSEVKNATDKMGTQHKGEALNKIFGVQGGRAVEALMNENNLEMAKALEKEIKNAEGTGNRIKDFIMGGAAGGMEMLRASISATFSTIFKSLEPLVMPIAAIFKAISDGLTSIARKNPAILQFIASFAGIMTVVGMFAIAKAKFGAFFKLLQGGIGSITLLSTAILALGLVFAFNFLKRWSEYLKNNETVAKEFSGVLEVLGITFSTLGMIIMETISAIFGFGSVTQDAGDKSKFMGKNAEEITEILKRCRENIAKLNIKIMEFSQWIRKNQDKIAFWGRIILGVIVAIKLFGTIISIFTAVSTAIKGVGAALSFLSANPVFLIIAAIVLFIGFLVILYQKNETFRNAVNTAWQAICEVVGAVVGAIVGFFVGLWQGLVQLYNENETFRGAVDAVWTFIQDHIAMIIGMIIAGPFGMLIGALVDLYTKNEEARAVMDGAWAAIKQAAVSALESIIEKVSATIQIVQGLGQAIAGVVSGDWGAAIDGLKNSWGGVKGLGGSFVKDGDRVKGVVNAYQNGYNQSKVKSLANSNGANQRAARRGMRNGTMSFQQASALAMQRRATGTDNFMAGHSRGWTTVDENGDEAIWLPNGSMIARNTTTRDMLNNLKSIKSNTRGGVSSAGTNIVNHNSFTIHVNGGKQAAHEILRELENLGIS